MDKISDDTIAKYFKENKDLVDHVNEAWMAPDFTPITAVYLDINTLKDLRLGLLLSKFPQELSYFTQHLDDYNHRPNRNPAYAYREVGMSSDDFTTWYYDPQNSDPMLNHAPDTELSYNLNYVINRVRALNNRSSYSQVTEYVVNLYPCKLSMLAQMYQEFLNQTYVDARTKFTLISEDPRTFTTEDWKKFGILFLDDLEFLLTDDSVFYKTIFGKVLQNTEVYAAPTAAVSVLKQWQAQGVDLHDPQQLKLRFKVTEAIFELCCKFKFVNFSIPKPESMTK